MEIKRIRSFLVGLVLVGVGAFVLVSLLSHDAHEGPFPGYPENARPLNACGVAGAYISAYALAFLGWSSYGVALLLVVAGALVLFEVRARLLPLKLTGVVFGLLALTIGLAIFGAGPQSTASAYEPSPGSGAGVAGILLAGLLYSVIGSTGTLIAFGVLAVAGTFLVVGDQMLALTAGLKKMRPAAVFARGAVKKRKALAGPGREEEPVPVPVDEFEGPIPEPDVGAEVASEPAAEAPTQEPEMEVITRTSFAAEKAGQRVRQDATEVRRAGMGPRAQFELPPIGILDKLLPGEAESEQEIRQRGRVLERTLSEFRVEAQVVRVRRGPVVTMYEMGLAAGTKVSKVESLANDLAISLKAPNVRIVAPIPGKSTIGVEVPNCERELVALREVMEETARKARKCAIPLFLGKDTGGNPMLMDLSTAPHLLIAGTTGSGKSVAINSMICSILMTRTPDELQLLLVDPKGVEFSDYRNLPHLMCPILVDMKKAASVLQWACNKMDERYALLSQMGVRDIRSYNTLGEQEVLRRLAPEEDALLDDIPTYMPHIVIIVDELGELMLVAAKEVENSVIRLSQKARAVGIHLICATQRPSVDVITGLIKANLPARIAFQVSSKVDSRTILDRNGAELLLGQGDMLLLPPGTSRLVRAQGTLISEEEKQRVIDFWLAQGEPAFQQELREVQVAYDESDRDDLYDEAVRVILEAQRGSVSLLQRRLSIGYSRAARLVDMMAEAGIVGPYRGSQAREVMLKLEEWEAAKKA